MTSPKSKIANEVSEIYSTLHAVCANHFNDSEGVINTSASRKKLVRFQRRLQASIKNMCQTFDP